ncbi:unnamed protein product [Aureobasidium vineae]|uniref:Uncharacterized protein n=1 Tax=Aureobasidium vineae TaxID=2773715 RepID=A0A9N8PFH1_9PEZI|nr:unnamed protein product [Aureobasidium vineae]
MFHLILSSAFVLLYYAISTVVPSSLHRLRLARKKPALSAPVKPVKPPITRSTPIVDRELELYKSLYHQLHNLEYHAKALPQARDVLVSFLSEAIDYADTLSEHNILDIQSFNAEALSAFIRTRDDAIGHRWEAYVDRRRTGGQRELFSDKAAAVEWLRQRAPVKYVDGAWLGHIHKISTPFDLRSVTKDAWQILSEELGDGDLEKHHAYVYRQLMKDIDAKLPEANSIDFIQPELGLDSKANWKAALAQLVISLFPNGFLPEILGFNLHFELLTWDTMRAIKELRELGIDDYYFRLHVSIDNSDSGHTAMALRVVLAYMHTVRETERPAKVSETWRRIQAGFLMSEMFDRAETSTSQSRGASDTLTPLEIEVVRIFKSKAAVSQKLHCACRVKLLGKSLAEWLDPQCFATEDSQKAFIDALGKAKPWIRAGDSKGSMFMQQISWKGQMFGAFTHTEIELLERWIDSLALPISSDRYRTFCRAHDNESVKTSKQDNVFTDYPVFHKDCLIQWPLETDHYALLELNVDFKRPPKMDKFLSLWFAHQGLLESFVTVPIMTCSESFSAIIKVLRVQYGFKTEQVNVAGMDEYLRGDVIDLVGIGLHIMDRANLGNPSSLAEVMASRDASHAEVMLDLSMKPLDNANVLVGMATAFGDLKSGMVSSTHCNLLGPGMSIVLRRMVERERDGLNVWRTGLVKGSPEDKEYRKGFAWAKSAIEECF